MDTPQKWDISPTMGETTIRHCEAGDANPILSLMREVFIDEMGWDRAFIVDAARVLVEMQGNHRAGHDLFLVAESGRKIVGVMFLLDIENRTGFIRWLVVQRDFRGIGIGRALLDRAYMFSCERSSGEARFVKLRLVTVWRLSLARRFYLREGFLEVGRRPDILWRMRHTLCFMEMELPPA